MTGMPSGQWPIPFLLDPYHLDVGGVAFFAVSILLAVTINGEAQAFIAAMLGDSRPGAKDRFHFNAFLHLSLLGTICYLAGGFGWPRSVDIDPDKFEHPRLYTVITRLAGPVANLLLAGIAGSLVSFMKILDYDPRGILMVIGVNVTTAIYNIIILPPLAGGAVVSAFIPRSLDKVKWLFNQAGPYLLVAMVLLERIRGELTFRAYLDPAIVAVVNFIKR